MYSVNAGLINRACCAQYLVLSNIVCIFSHYLAKYTQLSCEPILLCVRQSEVFQFCFCVVTLKDDVRI